jgi:hypothetical protein
MKQHIVFVLCLAACSSTGAEIVKVDAETCFDNECFTKTVDKRQDGGPRMFFFDCGDVVKACTTNTTGKLHDVVIVSEDVCASGNGKVWECEKDAPGLQLLCYCP